MQKEAVLAFIRGNARSCDDCVAAQLGIHPRQTVNLHTRSLTAEGVISRVEGFCLRCQQRKTVNEAAVETVSQANAMTGTKEKTMIIKRLPSPVILDGAELLQRLVERAGYPTIAHLIAEHTVFLHPDTVGRTHGEAVLPVVRAPFYTPRATVTTLASRRKVWADDNGPPTWAFLWAAGRRKGPDVQFNHIWPGATSPELYTALWNMCATPAFLAKTTDTRPEVRSLLQYHAYKLYGRLPAGCSVPEVPESYSELKWASVPGALTNLEAVYRSAMHRAPKNRATIAARKLGWLFSGWKPDPSL